MYSDAKRIHLLEKLKATEDDAVWEGVERLLQDSAGHPSHLPFRVHFVNSPANEIDSLIAAADAGTEHGTAGKKYLDLSRVAGTLSREEADELDRIIEEGCERIFPSEWRNPLDPDDERI